MANPEPEVVDQISRMRNAVEHAREAMDEVSDDLASQGRPESQAAAENLRWNAIKIADGYAELNRMFADQHRRREA